MSNATAIIGTMPPPPGVVPNFDDPPSLAPFVVAASVVLPALSTGFVALRFYTAFRLTSVRDASDILLAFAWLLGVAFSVMCLVLLRFGWSRHLWDVPFALFNINFMKLSAISGAFFGMSITFSKLSILVFYTRFASTADRHQRVVIYTLFVIVLVYGTVTSFPFLFACRPMERYWDFTITEGSCIDWKPTMLFNGVMNCLTDVAILLLPVWLLWELRLPLRQKMGVMGVMMTGGLVFGLSIARAEMTISWLPDPDITWGSIPLMIVIACEVHLGLVCVCLLAAKPFLRRHFPKILGNSHRGGTPPPTCVDQPRRRTTRPGVHGYSPPSSQDGGAIAMDEFGGKSPSQTAILERAATRGTEEEQRSKSWAHGPPP
ncbi:hypothetical protein MAPG_11543 [Magnaporthiopsis poae ATCC 64411]|uniref:Rhodopsin domain-containing protein n=1 Tax=Magnaporthiopsis poae (strain ATCC 64411 / 73-15) TaxID=644358 RepID=A0A0C4EFJ3_MAGP6|nr:hypothetical protein MAPG_11543 [Magnaporthiopsis poae ATCC 64411]